MVSIWKFLQKTSFHHEMSHFYFQLFSIYLSYPQYIPSFSHIIVISSWCPSRSMAPWPEAPQAPERRLVSHLLSMSQSFGRDLDERRAGALVRAYDRWWIIKSFELMDPSSRTRISMDLWYPPSYKWGFISPLIIDITSINPNYRT